MEPGVRERIPDPSTGYRCHIELRKLVKKTSWGNTGDFGLYSRNVFVSGMEKASPLTTTSCFIRLSSLALFFDMAPVPGAGNLKTPLDPGCTHPGLPRWHAYSVRNKKSDHFYCSHSSFRDRAAHTKRGSKKPRSIKFFNQRKGVIVP